MTLSPHVQSDVHKPNSSDVYLLALEITVPGVTEPIRVVSNTDDITWKGKLFQSLPFELDSVNNGSDGEIPSVELRISNVHRRVESYIHEYDNWCKRNGYRKITIRFLVLNHNDLASGLPVVEELYELQQPKADSQWVRFTIGASNLFNIRSPVSRMLKNACRFRFKDARCKYTGPEPYCGKSLAWCRKYKNSARFGGFPGIGKSGVSLGSL